MLEIRELRFRYAAHAPLVLDRVDLTLRDGEIGILLGRNGSGKTTLFKNTSASKSRRAAASASTARTC